MKLAIKHSTLCCLVIDSNCTSVVSANSVIPESLSMNTTAAVYYAWGDLISLSAIQNSQWRTTHTG